MHKITVDGYLAHQDMMNAFDAINTSLQYRNVASPGLAIGDSKKYVKVANNVTYLSGGVWTSRAATKSVTALTSASTTATATVTAHGYTTGDKVVIAGGDDSEYNGTYTITVTNANTFTYTFAGSLTSPETGTVTARVLAAFTATTHDITHNASAAQEAKYLLSLNSSGVVTVTKGATAASGASKLPEIPAAHTPIGYVKIVVAAGSTDFDATTDDLDAAHLTTTYVNLGFVAPRFDAAQ